MLLLAAFLTGHHCVKADYKFHLIFDVFFAALTMRFSSLK